MNWTRNFQKPEGFLGKFLLANMNLEHTPISKWGLSHYAWQKNTTVLDIGCGGGMNLKRMLKLSPQGNVCGIDISQESLNKSRKVNAKEIGKRCTVKYGSADAIPFGKDTFDIVTAFETIYFWGDMEKSLKEIARVLKPNGTFLIVNELSDPANIWNKMIKDMTVYTPPEIKALLQNAGFEDIKVYTKGNFRLCVSARIKI